MKSSKKSETQSDSSLLFKEDLRDVEHLIESLCEQVELEEQLIVWKGFTQSPEAFEDQYARLIVDHGLTEDERFIIVLALLQEISPYALNSIKLMHDVLDKTCPEFGGAYRGDSTFLPTGDTAVFLLGLDDYDQRIEFMDRLAPDGKLSKLNLVRLFVDEPYAPYMTGILTPTEELIERIVFNRDYQPKYSQNFPAQRVSSQLEWEDLILSYHTWEGLSEMENWLACHDRLERIPTVMKVIKRGYRALFYGPSGTGKTLTASLLGKKYGREVYQVDLSMMVSKYIGETEKNLKNIFDIAENRDWILFFDEADALFGKRTQTSSSNDRYANQEVAYLLQRIEDYPGMVVLASNLKANMDKAFLRRFQSMVHFPTPSIEERHQLWTNTFNTEIKTSREVDFRTLASKYEITGAAISNILRYCTLAVLKSGSEEISPETILEGIKRERAKEGKSTAA